MSDKPLPLNSNMLLYSNLLPKIREVARDHGYAVGVHGSMVTDLDLMLMPWVENVRPVHTCIVAIAKACGGFIPNGAAKWVGEKWAPADNPGAKPHDRFSYTIAFGGVVYLDISVIIPPSPALEKSCSDSHAPSSASSGSTTPAGSSTATTTETSVGTTDAAAVAVPSDSARRASSLEKSCTDSHAPSSASATVSPTSSSTHSGGCATASPPTPTSDSARRALADNNRQLCKHPESMRAIQMPGPNDHGRVWCGVCGHHFIGKPPEKPADHLPPAVKGEGDAKPDAGRAEEVKCDHPADAIRTGNDFGTGVNVTVRMCAKCGLILDETTTPAPRPSPGEVAEGIVHEAMFGTVFVDARVVGKTKELIEAAIVRERSPIGH